MTQETANHSINDENTPEQTLEAPKVLFKDFQLPEQLHRALDVMGFESPTGVQEKTLEAALEGNDLMVSAQTGSGKTVAFLLPSIASVLEKHGAKIPREKKAAPEVLVICPTRELVEQVTQDAVKLVKFVKGMRIGTVMGGMPYGKQLAGIQSAKVVVASPGRLLDLEQRGQIDLSNVTHLILDEADRMLDLGFQEDLANISDLCENREQTLLFSATFADNIVGLAENLMQDPTRITLASTQDKHTDITQRMYYADNLRHKEKLLMHWLENEEINQAVIFVPTQIECDSLTEVLRDAGQNVVNLHGGMRQFMRTKRLNLIRKGRVKILVATDVAARGLDVPTISHVINYGLPMRHEDYVHRIGRTGRAGRKGNAISVTTHKERHKVRMLERFIAQEIEVKEIEGLEPTTPPPERRPNSSKRHGKKGFGGGRSRGRDGGRRDGGFGKKSFGGNSDRPRRDGDSFKKDGFKKDGFKSDRPRRDRDGEGFKRDGFKSDRPRRDGDSFRKDGFKKDGFKKDRFNDKPRRDRDGEGFSEKKSFKKSFKKPFGSDDRRDGGNRSDSNDRFGKKTFAKKSGGFKKDGGFKKEGGFKKDGFKGKSGKSFAGKKRSFRD